MALLTQKAIIGTFEEMLEEMPFDKITVSALVKRCGVSANTFYYHYQDIYALLDVWLEKTVNDIRTSLEDNLDWKVEAKAIFLACQKNTRIIDHIFGSLSRERLEHYTFTRTKDSFYRFVRMRTEDKNLTEEQISEIAMFCRYSFVGIFLKANWEHFKIDVDSEINQISFLFDTFIDSAAEKMNEKK